MEERVEGAELEPAVGPQDGPATSTEASAPEFDGLGVGGWHRGLLGVGRLPAGAVGPPGPEGLAGGIEAVQHLDAA